MKGSSCIRILAYACVVLAAVALISTALTTMQIYAQTRAAMEQRSRAFATTVMVRAVPNEQHRRIADLPMSARPGLILAYASVALLFATVLSAAPQTAATAAAASRQRADRTVSARLNDGPFADAELDPRRPNRLLWPSGAPQSEQRSGGEPCASDRLPLLASPGRQQIAGDRAVRFESEEALVAN